MIKIIFLILATFASFLNCHKKQEFRFASGFQGGTYSQIGESLKSIPDFKVDLRNSKGSIDNIYLVKDKKVDISLCQLDVLQNAAFGDSDIAEKVKILFPLYGEEVHLIAKREIPNFQSLKGKKISIGDSESGTKLTSLIFLSQWGITGENSTFEELDSTSSLPKVLSGELDAMVLVAGIPVKILSELDESQKSKIQLLSFSKEDLQAVRGTGITYKRTEIPSTTYSWEIRPTETILVQSVFIGTNDLKEEQVSTFLKTIWNSREKIVHQHEKWKSLNTENFQFIQEKNTNLFHPGAIKILPTLQ